MNRIVKPCLKTKEAIRSLYKIGDLLDSDLMSEEYLFSWIYK